jgi:uncharacterized protein (DUF58 family)
VRHIDWRQSARRGRTVVRRFRDEGSADWFLCVDSSASVKLHAGKWAMQVQLASALGFALLSAGHRMGLLLFSDRVAGCLPLGRGAQQHTRLLSLLNESGAPRQSVPGKSTSRYERGSSLGQCRDFMEKQCHVFVISDLLEPAGMREDLRALRASSSGVHALQVLSPDEVSIAARGSARLHDIESGRAEVVTLSDDAIARAGARLAEHQAGLARDCAALGVRFAACATTDRWERVLLAHLAAPG